MKKFISLFLVFSILLLSGNLFAKERKGADGNDIRPGEKVTFEAICFDLDSHNEHKSTRIELDWLEGDITTLSNLQIQSIRENERRFRELEAKKAGVKIK